MMVLIMCVCCDTVICANVPYWIVRAPAETLKTRQQVGSTSESTLNDIRTLYEQQGLAAILQSMYGSYSSNFAYALPADIIKFVACKLV